jgi:hypothetical protein
VCCPAFARHPVTAIKLRKKLPLLLDAYMDVGSRAPTVGALGDAGAIAERVGVTTARTDICSCNTCIPTSMWVMQEVEQRRERLPRRIKNKAKNFI